MPATLKTDIWDQAYLDQHLYGLVDPESEFHAACRAVYSGASTMASAVSMATRLRAWLRWLHAAAIDPLAVTGDTVRDWLSRQKHLSPETARANLGIVRCLYEECIDRELVVRNPARRIHIGHYAAEHAPALSVDDARLILAAIVAEMDDPERRLSAARDYAIFALALTIGPRSAELRRLVWEDVDLDEDRPLIHLFAKGRKHETKRLPPVAVEALRVYRDILTEEIGREPRPHDALLVPLAGPGFIAVRDDPHSTLTPMSDAALYALVRRRLEDAAVTGRRLGPHRLRASAATIAWLSGADPISIMRMLGHARVDITVRHYIDPAQALMASAADVSPLGPAGLISSNDRA